MKQLGAPLYVLKSFFTGPSSYEREQLGLLINTRTMMVSLPQDKLDKIKALLNQRWHAKRRSFKLLEGAQLLGLLEHAASVNPWGRFLLAGIRHSVNYAIKHCRSCQIKKVKLDKVIANIHKNPNKYEAYLQEKHFTSKLMSEL